MRIMSILLMVVVPAWAGVPSPSHHEDGAAGAGGNLTGTWKLVVLGFSYGDHELAIVQLDERPATATAAIVASQRMLLGIPTAAEVALKGDRLTLALKGRSGGHEFQGRLVHDGPDAGKFLGIFPIRGEIYPARLERTTERSLGPLQSSPLIARYYAATRERDPKAKVKKLEALIEGNTRSSSHWIYPDLLSEAAAAGLTGKEVGALVGRWIDEAKPHGESWLSEVRIKALRAIIDHPPYAQTSLELARAANEAVGEQVSAEQRLSLARLLARAAGLAGQSDLAREAAARADRLESQVDAEYLKKLLPFQPARYAGRKDPKADRVVLLELFTGAQCPPCVAADVAFDALLKTYQPTELIGLQYHLHIPGPDPLTTKDSEARQEYYGDAFIGTPTTCFNGRAEASGGGPLSASRNKYDEYRPIIDRELEGRKAATIELSATRAGDAIQVVAKASLPTKATARENDKSSKKAEASATRPFLRLALTEESIRYIGGNGMRFHHHVVRAFPGGPKGKELASGEGQVTVTIKLAELRRDLERSLRDVAKQGGLPKALPELALKDLAVVAFVQDDADKRVLHAVSVPVREASP
ncbi:MAG TPA: hypothetical protein VFF52_15590 [Isosphaeraceae bacterium]|nr:hypothetical protein [Isosphaeraceae bacterium]